MPLQRLAFFLNGMISSLFFSVSLVWFTNYVVNQIMTIFLKLSRSSKHFLFESYNKLSYIHELMYAYTKGDEMITLSAEYSKLIILQIMYILHIMTMKSYKKKFSSVTTWSI